MLGRFIPDFGRVVSMMQFNMYHHFTVDEHLIRTIGFLSDIERGKFATEHPVSTEIIRTIDNRRALYVAALPARHRQGPRRGPFASPAPASRASSGPRFGLTPSETETAAWLVEHHLAMSHIRPEPRPERPQDHPRLRRPRAEPRAAEAAAAAHRRRHPRRRARRVDRLEGPAPAHPLFRDRAAARRRPHHAHAQRARGAARRMPCGSGSPTGRRRSSSASSTVTIRPIGCAPISTSSPSTPS